jgi:hypothetical protein
MYRYGSLGEVPIAYISFMRLEFRNMRVAFR